MGSISSYQEGHADEIWFLTLHHPLASLDCREINLKIMIIWLKIESPEEEPVPWGSVQWEMQCLAAYQPGGVKFMDGRVERRVVLGPPPP